MIIINKQNMIRKIHILILAIFQTFFMFGQSNISTLNLQECIDIALKNNLDFKSAELRAETANINFRQSKNALLPTLNGNFNIGKASGRSINPFTNSFINEELTFSNAGLRLGAVVFNGFQLINRWKQQKLNMKASEMEKEDAKYNLILNVTLTYLQVMNTKDLYVLAQNRLETTNEQLKRLKSMFEEEMANPSEYRDFQGLKANDEANLVSSKNNFEDAKLNLMSLLNIDTDFEVASIDMSIDLNTYSESFEDIYIQALQNMAIVKAGKFRLKASEKGVSVAKSLYVPEISLFANLNTNYSSAAQIFNDSGSSIVETGDFVTLDGQDYQVLSEQTSFTPENIAYRDQFDNNLNSSAGIAVNIPIFNGFNAKNNVALEKIKKEEATIELERIKLQLRTAIEQTYKDMNAAFERYELLKQQAEAYQESMRINEVRFTNGVNNNVEYIISKNNLENARISLNNVKYEYLLRVKLLEYYTGQI
jgi:outer membrane protein